MKANGKTENRQSKDRKNDCMYVESFNIQQNAFQNVAVFFKIPLSFLKVAANELNLNMNMFFDCEIVEHVIQLSI